VQQNQQLTARMHQQQQEIEALLQLMLEKHVGSVSEFKRHMLKLQSGDARSERLHSMITGGGLPTNGTNGTSGTTAGHAPHARRPEPEIAEPEVDRPRRYTL
jgi:hypothetical protein